MRKTKNNNNKNNLFKNKKGFVWADLVGAFQRGVSWFLETVPRPIKMLLFLLFLLGFVSIFGWLLNSTGNFCDTNGNNYKTGFFSFPTNIDLLANMPKESDINKVELEVDETLVAIFPKCTSYFTDPYYYEESCLFCNEPKVYLPNGTGNYYDGGACTDCETKTIYNDVTGDKSTVCITDAHRIPHEDKSWFQKITCGKTLGGCEPPTNYYYDFEINRYVCEEGEYCEGKTLGDIWNDLLKDSGAKITISDSGSERSYQNAVAIDCDVGSLEPQFKFFGIKIFDYKLWVAIYLLLGIIWAVYKIKFKS